MPDSSVRRSLWLTQVGQQVPPQGNVPSIAVAKATPPPTAGRAYAVYSATERVVYVFGGAPGEVWRQDIVTQRAERIVTPLPPLPKKLVTVPKVADAPVGQVLAATYDVPTRRLVAIDEVILGAKKFRRIIEVSVELGRVRTLFAVPTFGKMQRVSLVPLPDGSFAAIMQHGAGLAWSAVRFTVSFEENLKWGGWTHGVGELQEEPFLAHARVLMPVRHGSKSELDTLELKDFKGSSSCDEL